MKKVLRQTFIPIAVFSLVYGCTKKFDEINMNPDKSTKSNPAWLATGMLTSITSGSIDNTKSFMQPFMLAKYILWTENQEGYQYNRIGRASFARLAVLRNVPIMNEYAHSESAGLQNSYRAFGHFVRAWQFFQVTMQLGDIPYSEAVKGESEGKIKPGYDSQKTVFLGILNELDSANTLFEKGENFSGDFVYKGSTDKWQRLVNSFQLHVLMQLYKKTDDADLQVVKRFKDVASRPLMRNYLDNFAVTYVNAAGYAYPWSNTPVQINSFTIYPMVGATLIQPLKENHDRRLFYYAEPAESQLAAGKKASDWEAYLGIDAAEPIATTKVLHATGKFSDVNHRYAQMYNAEPVGLFNYWDCQFLLAEGALRGWINGTPAQDYYEEGVKASMEFLMNYAPDSYAHGMAITPQYIGQFLSSIALSGSNENQLRQIITQKYIANFLQDVDKFAWFEQRRTGYPAFTLNPETNLNIPETSFPKRWLYPSDELNYNSDNVAEAIKRQYNGDDSVNMLMWILKD